MRAYELATGEIWDMLDEMHNTFLQEILEGNSCKDHAEIQAAFADFAHSKTFMVEYLQQKLVVWKSLPWKMVSLNHFHSSDAQRARKAASQMIKDFDAKEAEHAHTKQAIIHRGKISPAYVSCRLRFPEIREIIDNPPELKSLLSAFKIIKDPNSLAKLFGFWNHPLWQKSVQQNYSKMLKMQLAATILYSGDPESQYAKDVQNKRRRKDKKKAMEQRVKKALRAYGNLGKGMSWSHGNVERVSIAHHLQERLEMGNLYSLSQQSLNFPTLPQAQMPLQGLEEKRYPVSQEPALQIQAEPWQSLQPLGPESETSAAIVLADDADKDKAPGQLSVEKVVFLRIVKSKPSSLRNVDLPAAETKRLGSTDMCVSFHKARMAPTIQGQDPSLCVSVEPTVAMGVPNTVAVLSVCGSSNIDVDLGPLTQSMRCWMIDKQLQFALRDYTVSAAASHLLRDAVLGRAFPNCSREQWLVLDTSNDAVMAAAKELQALGIFEPQSLAGGSACFALTPRGVQQLHHMHAVQHPEKVFRSAETLAALPAPQMLECTSWELMQILKHQGWEMKKCPAGQKRRGLPPITRSTVERKFYLSSLHAHSKHHMAYMKALCQAETLFEHGVVHAIHHGQNPTYYQAILDEAHDGVIAPVPLAIEAGGSAEIAAAIPMQLELDEHIVLAVNPARPALRESDIVTNQDPLDNFCASKGQESALEKESVCSDPGNSADSAESWTPEFVPSSDEGANQSPVGDPPQSPTASHDITPPDPDLPRPPDILGPAETGTPRGSDNQVAETQPPQEPLTMDDGTLRRDAWVTREKHPDSFHWGVFRFTFTPASKRPPYGQFQAKPCALMADWADWSSWNSGADRWSEWGWGWSGDSHRDRSDWHPRSSNDPWETWSDWGNDQSWSGWQSNSSDGGGNPRWSWHNDWRHDNADNAWRWQRDNWDQDQRQSWGTRNGYTDSWQQWEGNQDTNNANGGKDVKGKGGKYESSSYEDVALSPESPLPGPPRSPASPDYSRSSGDRDKGDSWKCKENFQGWKHTNLGARWDRRSARAKAKRIDRGKATQAAEAAAPEQNKPPVKEELAMTADGDIKKEAPAPPPGLAQEIAKPAEGLSHPADVPPPPKEEVEAPARSGVDGSTVAAPAAHSAGTEALPDKQATEAQAQTVEREAEEPAVKAEPEESNEPAAVETPRPTVTAKMEDLAEPGPALSVAENPAMEETGKHPPGAAEEPSRETLPSEADRPATGEASEASAQAEASSGPTVAPGEVLDFEERAAPPEKNRKRKRRHNDPEKKTSHREKGPSEKSRRRRRRKRQEDLAPPPPEATPEESGQ
ncbi:unnamed protein product, partial [Durusdinium trenchii]